MPLEPGTRFGPYEILELAGAGGMGGEEQWVAAQVARLPVLKGRLNAFIVPGGQEKASFREPQTAQLLRTRVAEVLGLAHR